MTLVAPRILNDVSYVRRINHEIHFAWQAQFGCRLRSHEVWQRLLQKSKDNINRHEDICKNHLGSLCE